MNKLTFFILLFWHSFSYGQFSSDAYSNMMAGAQTNFASSLSLFYNPALQLDSNQTVFGVGNTFHLPNSGIYDLQLALTTRKKKSSLGIGLSQNGFAQFNKTNVLLHYALLLDTSWSVGLTAGITSSNYLTQRNYAPLFSLGTSKQLNKQINLSFIVFSEQVILHREVVKKEFQYTWKLGSSFTSLNKQFSAYLSGQYTTEFALGLCLYYRLSDNFHFFVAGKNAHVTYSFGSKIKLKSLAIVLGFHYNSPLGFAPSSVIEYAF